MRDHPDVPPSSQTIARLAAAFDGGLGPSHATIERIWFSEDASEYLPPEGNKAERVIGGLRTLRDGRRGTSAEALAPDHEKLTSVARQLAVKLLADGLVSESAVTDILDQGRSAVTPLSGESEPPAQLPDAQLLDSAGPGAARIFVVHGHDHLLLYDSVRVLERATGLEVTVLHEQANEGRTVLEKFEHHAGAAAFAVVLITPDDVGGVRGGSQQPRGRQNVIFELGFFYGKLGRSRVAVLLAAGVEPPSDIAGLVYIKVDDAGAWKLELGRELEAAGIHFEFRRIA